MKPPRDVGTFLSVINKMRRMRKKAANIFFEEIEVDINNKSNFIKQQSEKELEMHNLFNDLILYK